MIKAKAAADWVCCEVAGLLERFDSRQCFHDVRVKASQPVQSGHPHRSWPNVCSTLPQIICCPFRSEGEIGASMCGGTTVIVIDCDERPYKRGQGATSRSDRLEFRNVMADQNSTGSIGNVVDAASHHDYSSN